MTELLINESTMVHNILNQEINANKTRIKQFQHTTNSINGLLSNFSESLQKQCRGIFKQYKNDQEEDSSVIFLNKYIIDLLMELTKKINQISKKITNQITEPLQQFFLSQKSSYQQILQKSVDQISSIEANASFLNQLTKNFNTNSKSQDLSPTQQQQLKTIYEYQMQKCNEKWLHIKNNYQELLNDLNSVNSFRCNWMVKNQVKFCKQINKLINSDTIVQSLNSYEQLYEENQLLSILIKEKVRDKLGKSILLEERAMEQFDGQNHFAYKEKVIIDQFINMFISFSKVKQQQKKHQKARSLILQNLHWSHYFLTRLRSNLHTQIKLPAIKYHEMTTIVKYLFATCAQNDDNQQILYNLLYISYRLTYNGNYIIRQVGKHDGYWQKSSRWIRLIEYVRSVRDQLSDKKLIMNKKNNDETGNKKIKKYFRNGLQWISQNPYNNGLLNKISTQKKIRSEKMIVDAKAYDIVCQMNYFMARLEISQKFIFTFMVNIGNQYGFSLENVKKLLHFHYFNKQNKIDQGSKAYLNRKKKIQQKYKHLQKDRLVCICVGKSLKYLEVSPQLLNLRLVCKLWSQELRQKLNNRFLIQESNQFYLRKNRLDLYLQICPSAITSKIFDKMLHQLPDFTQHSEIITLDAKRSLSWDESLREQLITILKCFAFYHPNVGYLQGMNYLCENILKLTDQTYTAYKIFEYLMNNQFYGMYNSNFTGLKIKIYQFMRIVQREKPKLYEHFLSEKLEGEHFLLPWAITLWGQMSGDMVWLLWDGFLCKGWKWWIKTGLWLLNILEPELLNMNFEQIMKTFSQLNTGLLNMNIQELKDFGIDYNNAKTQIDAIPVHLDTLKQIEQEYKLKQQLVNEYIKKVKNTKKNTF